MTSPSRAIAFAASAALGTLGALPAAQAASHREAPLTALDRPADITDFFAFVSYDDPTKVTMIMNVDPLLEPSNGPNYFPFGSGILYTIKVDNDHDAVEDVSFEFKFKTEVRAPDVFTGFVGAGTGLVAPPNSPPPVPPGTLIVPPAITALDGPGSQGLSLRQTYSVTKVDGAGAGATRTQIANGLIALPSNVGPRTMPDYASLYNQAIHPIPGDIRVFAGTVDDPFWIDLGGAFDSLNFRAGASDVGIPGVLSDSQDLDDDTNFAADAVSGYNVNAIAIEVPVEMLTQDGAVHSADEPEAVIGTWATTSRPQIRIYTRILGLPPLGSSNFVQVQRMANPLFNELVIGTGFKNTFSREEPRNDVRFSQFVDDPLLARVLNALYAGVLPIPDPPRTDLLPLVQYLPPIAPPGTPPGPVADLLRLNTGIPPTPAEKRSRLGFLTLLDGNTANDDPAGYPNGRRVSDDVTDIAARAVVGVLAGPPFNGFPNNRIGDGVNANDVPYLETFPYLGLAHSGRDRRHVDPDEPGCDGTCPVD